MTLNYTINWNDLTSVAHQYISDEIPDAMIYSNAIWKYLIEEYHTDDPGGSFIQLPINFGENPNVGFIAGDGSSLINLNPYQSMLPGTLVRKTFVAPLSITSDDIATTTESEEAVVYMLEAKVKQTKETLVRVMTNAIWGSASSNVNQINGMQDIFAASGTAYAGLLDTDVNTQFGLDLKGKSKWLPEINATTTLPTFTNISPAQATIKAKSQMYGSSTKYSKHLILSNAGVQAAFINNEQLKQRFTDSKLADDGFQAVRMNGMDWVIDEFCPGSETSGSTDNWLVILTAPSIKWYRRFGLGGKKHPMDGQNMQVPNQALMSQREFIVGNLGCHDRRVNYAFKNIQL